MQPVENKPIKFTRITEKAGARWNGVQGFIWKARVQMSLGGSFRSGSWGVEGEAEKGPKEGQSGRWHSQVPAPVWACINTVLAIPFWQSQ